MSISSVNFEGQQEYKPKHRTLRHVANVAMTAGGLAGTAVGANYLFNNVTKVVPNTAKKVVGPSGMAFPHIEVVTKLGRNFAKIGQKIYNFAVQKLNNCLDTISKGIHPMPSLRDTAAARLGVKALIPVAILTVLGLGIYNAGKINGDK